MGLRSFAKKAIGNRVVQGALTGGISEINRPLVKPIYDAAKNGGLKNLLDPQVPAGNSAYAAPGQKNDELYRRALAGSSGSYTPGQIQAPNMSSSTNLLHQAALGQGPSAAGSQLNAGLALASQQGQALAAGGRGAERGALRLQALQGAGDRAAVGAQQAGALRAQEMQSAQGQYANALQGQGQLSLQAQQAQEDANRSGFQATSQHQQGMLGTAQSAVGGGLDAQKAMDQDARERYQLMIEKRKAQIAGGTSLVNAVIPG